MRIRFKKRNEDGLHCMFCNARWYNCYKHLPQRSLYETSPIKGIVCGMCKKQLEIFTKDTK